jgi:hypothetical protein
VAVSRRSDRKRDIGGTASQHKDAAVRLECPHGHTVGYLYAADRCGPMMLTDEHRGGGRPFKGVLPLRLGCRPCFTDAGMRMDLRLSQERAQALLAAALADPTHREHNHILGG